MLDISLIFEEDQSAMANEWILGYDKSPEILAKWVAMQKKAHEGFRKVLESISPQQ